VDGVGFWSGFCGSRLVVALLTWLDKRCKEEEEHQQQPPFPMTYFVFSLQQPQKPWELS